MLDQETDSKRGQPSKKLMRDSTVASTCLDPVCVVHVPKLKSDKYGEFTLFSSKEDAADTLANLQDIKHRRLAEPLNSPYKMTKICNKIPNELSQNHGYHQECYKRFTMNLNQLVLKEDQQESTSRLKRKSGNNTLFTPDCIFCNSEKCKKIISKRNLTTEGLSEFEIGGWQDIEKEAVIQRDEKLLTRIRGKDLFACKAKYHLSCKESYYVRDPAIRRRDNDEQRNGQRSSEEAHNFAFGKICEVVENEVLLKKRMLKLGDLRSLYIAHLEETSFPNPEYKGKKLKNKLQNHPKFSSALSFCQVNEGGPQCYDYIVYGCDRSIDEAIQKAYELGSLNIIKESGNHLHDVIHQYLKETDELRGSPSVLELEHKSKIPPELETFLSHVITKQSLSTTPEVQRLILSIAQDVCSAAATGDGEQEQSAVSNPTKPSQTMVEVSSATGLNVDDFLFSKLFKSVNEEGNRTIDKVVKALFNQKFPEKYSTSTLGQILNEESISGKPKSIHTRCKKILEEKLCNAEFDINCGISLLQEIFHDEYKNLSKHCQAQVRSLKRLRNTLSQRYPLVLCDLKAHDRELNNELEKNSEYIILVNEITKLEEKKNGFLVDAKREEIQSSIDEKKKEKYIFTEIEKLRVILNDILENVSCVLEEDFTDCKSMVNKNLTDISKAEEQQYDESNIDLFKDDAMHKLITKGREELKNQYRHLKIANPCPWICMDQSEKSSVNNFRIEKIFTPLKFEASRQEVSTENLLITNEVSKSKFLILHGLAGSGKTSLCLHYLHHWTEGTDKIETLKDYSLVIYVELRTVRSGTIKEYLKKQRMKNSTDCINDEDLVQQLSDLNVLFIIDGYDEANTEYRKIVKDICKSFPNHLILVTTRTELRDEVKYMSTRINLTFLKICGFDESRVKSFTEKVFDAVKQSKYYMETQTKTSREINSSEFLHYVQGRGKILEKHLELPLTLALMIYMWIDCEEVLNKVTTCTSLYYELYKLCQEKIKTRIRDCKSADLQNLLILLGKKGWQLLQDGEEVLDDVKEIDQECRKRKVPKEELLSAFLMYDVDNNSDESSYDYSFMHRTQMEYLSAYYLAEEAEEKNLNVLFEKKSLQFGFHQVYIFLVGHFTLKNNLDNKMEEVFKLLAKLQIEDDNFDFWWRLLTESQIDGEPNKNLSQRIIENKLNKEKWKLSSGTVVPGLELLIHTPAQIKELVIEIQNGEDPYDIRDFFIIMQSLKEKLSVRYHKKRPLIVELFFWQHCETRCRRPSNELLGTLYPWGHLRDFAGSVGKYNDKFMLNFCFNLKNLRVRVETIDSQISLSKSLAKISKYLRQLRVILDLDPEECNPETLNCLTCDIFKGKLELTLQHTEDKHKNWIVDVVKKVSGGHGCHKLILEKSTLSFPTVKYIVEECDVVREKYKIGSTNDLTPEQWNELEKLQKRFHVDVEWDT